MALSNLELALGREFGPAERERIGHEYYRYLGCVALETPVLIRRSERPLSDHFELRNLDVARRVLEEHGAAILVSCHGGPWELMGAVLCDVLEPIYMVFRPLPNPRLDRWLSDLRGRLGMPLIPTDGTAGTALLRLLRSGRSVGLLCDLKSGGNTIPADFLGVPAETTSAPGVLAARLGLPVLPAYAYRIGPYRYGIYFEDPISPRKGVPLKECVREVVEEVNRSIARFVRAHPEQWQWNYRRWKQARRSASVAAA